MQYDAAEQRRVAEGQVIGRPFFGSFLWASKEMNNYKNH